MNGIESQEINPHMYDQIIYDKEAKNLKWRKYILINKQHWENWTAICNGMKLDHYLSSYINFNTKWITDLNIRPKS